MALKHQASSFPSLRSSRHYSRLQSQSRTRGSRMRSGTQSAITVRDFLQSRLLQSLLRLSHLFIPLSPRPCCNIFPNPVFCPAFTFFQLTHPQCCTCTICIGQYANTQSVPGATGVTPIVVENPDGSLSYATPSGKKLLPTNAQAMSDE